MKYRLLSKLETHIGVLPVYAVVQV